MAKWARINLESGCYCRSMLCKKKRWMEREREGERERERKSHSRKGEKKLIGPTAFCTKINCRLPITRSPFCTFACVLFFTWKLSLDPKLDFWAKVWSNKIYSALFPWPCLSSVTSDEENCPSVFTSLPWDIWWIFTTHPSAKCQSQSTFSFSLFFLYNSCFTSPVHVFRVSF